MKNLASMCTAMLVVLIAVLGCSRFSTLGNVDLYEGDNAAKAAAAIKDKIGASKIGVIMAEVRKDSMKITVQAPDNPKNMDEYTYEKGRASGPKPVQAMSFGNLEMTADKYHLTDFSEINFAAIPETVKKAIARSGLENGRVDVISMDQEYAETTHPDLKAEKKRKKDELQKQIEDKMNECFKASDENKCTKELSALQKQQQDTMMGRGERQWDLAWRIFVEGPRGRKDFYADKQGNLVDNRY
jgi:hypothetical protein